jgi:hypothetical protein
VAEVNSSLQEFLHRNIRQKSSSFLFLSFRPRLVEEESPQFRNLSTTEILLPQGGIRMTGSHWERLAEKLSLRELEPLARAFLPVLLSFLGTRISSKETALTQTRAEFRVVNNQGPGDTQLGCARLAVNAPAPSIDENIEFPRQLGADQGLLDLSPQGLRGKVTRESTPIDNQLAIAGPKNNSGY